MSERRGNPDGQATQSPTATHIHSNSPDTHGTVVALEAVEQRYVEVMRQLAGEPQLAAFKNEYEKLHRLLAKSREGERRLMGKVNELQQELSGHQSKAETAIALSQEDEASIATLRKEIEKAWAMADTAHAREVESRKAIQVLKKQVAELDSLVEQSAGLSMGQEAYLRELLSAKKEKESDHSLLQARLDRIVSEHKALLKRASLVQNQELTLGTDLEAKTAAYQQLLTQLEEEQRERTAKEQSVRSYRMHTSQVMSELERQRERAAGLSTDVRNLTKEADEMASSVQTLARQLEERQLRFQSESDRLSNVEAHNARLKAQEPLRASQLREKQNELHSLQRLLRGVESKAREQQQDLQGLVQTRDELLLAANAASAAMDQQLQALKKEERELHAVEAELKTAMKEKTRAIAANSGKENIRAQTEGRRTQEESKRRRLEQDLSATLTENEALRRQVFMLEQVQNKELGAAQTATLAYHRTLDHIRSRRADVRSLRDLLAVHEQKQKTQQELLDRVTADRNRAEKQLRETESEWRQLTERHDSRREEIELMKGDLVAKEAAVCQLHIVNKQLQREITNTEQRASHLREDRGHAGSRIEALQHEAQQLQQIISNCDAEKAKQSMRLMAITNERNIIAGHLIRRNEELAFLRDKVQLQQTALDKGAADYRQRTDEVVASRDRLQELRLRCRLILVRLRYMQVLRKKETAGERELTRERARVRALTEELRKPLNVHRWRQLEGSAPDLLDGIAKVHMLQHAFMTRCDELQSMTAQIQEKEKEYRQLRARLARLPGPEAAEDLVLYKENIEKRHEQIAAMASELGDVEQHAEVLTEEVRQLNLELAEVKRNFYSAKAKKDALERERKALRQTWGGTSAAVARLAMSSRTAAAATQHDHNHHPQEPHASASAAPPTHRGGGGSGNGAEGDGTYRSNNSSPDHTLSNPPQRVLSKSGRRYLPSASRPTPSETPREAVIARERELLNVLSTGAPAPSFPLQKPKNQKQFVGGGFALTR